MARVPTRSGSRVEPSATPVSHEQRAPCSHYATLPERDPAVNAPEGRSNPRVSGFRTPCSSRGTVGPRISAVDEIRMRPPPEGGRIPRPRGGHTRIGARRVLPHPSSSPRLRAATNGPAEAMPRLVGPRPRGPRGPLRSEVEGPGDHRCTLPATVVQHEQRVNRNQKIYDCQKVAPSAHACAKVPFPPPAADSGAPAVEPESPRRGAPSLSSHRRNSALAASPARKWKPTRAMLPSGRRSMLRPLTLPALASIRRLDGRRTPSCRGRSRRRRPARAGSRIERPLRVATTRARGSSSGWVGRPGQAVGVLVLPVRHERRLRAPEGDDVVGELVAARDLDEHHRALAPALAGLDPGARALLVVGLGVLVVLEVARPLDEAEGARVLVGEGRDLQARRVAQRPPQALARAVDDAQAVAVVDRVAEVVDARPGARGRRSTSRSAARCRSAPISRRGNEDRADLHHRLGAGHQREVEGAGDRVAVEQRREPQRPVAGLGLLDPEGGEDRELLRRPGPPVPMARPRAERP